MKIVIDIDKQDYEDIQVLYNVCDYENHLMLVDRICSRVVHGTPTTELSVDEFKDECRKCGYVEIPDNATNGDGISRDAVRKILTKYRLGESKIAEELNELPSVTQMSDKQLYKNGFADGYEQGHKDREQKQEKLTKTDLWIKAGSSNRIKRSDIENNNELSESLIEGYIK